MENYRNLPKGICYLRNRQRFMGRFQHNKQSYTFYDKNLDNLIEKMNKAKYELSPGLDIKQKPYSVDEWHDIWIKYKENEVKYGTVLDYRETYRLHIKQPLGQKKLKKITSDHIQDIYYNLAAECYSKSTLKSVRAVLNGMFTYALRKKVILINPLDGTYLPKIKKPKKKQVLSLEQQKIFLAYTKGNVCEPLIKLAAGTGMRIGEIRGLQWKNVDFKNHLIHVRTTLKYGGKGKGYRLDTPKSESSERSIYMLPDIAELLSNERTLQSRRKIMAGDYWEPCEGLEDLVFTTSNGRPLHVSKVNIEIKKIQQAMIDDGINMPPITPHLIRHMFATRCLEKGIPPKVVQDILGHSTIEMTLDTYSHVLPDFNEKEMMKLQDVI